MRPKKSQLQLRAPLLTTDERGFSHIGNVYLLPQRCPMCGRAARPMVFHAHGCHVAYRMLGYVPGEAS